jgi:hypothetical protein
MGAAVGVLMILHLIQALGQIETAFMNYIKLLVQSVAWIALMLAGVLMLGGCSTKASLGKLYGKYKAEYPYGIEYLKLNQDGTYFQEYRSKNGIDHLSQNGQWSYDVTEGRLSLKNPLDVDNGFGQPNPISKMTSKGVWFLTVHPGFTTVQITINEDDGFYFEKL